MQQKNWISFILILCVLMVRETFCSRPAAEIDANTSVAFNNPEKRISMVNTAPDSGYTMPCENTRDSSSYDLSGREKKNFVETQTVHSKKSLLSNKAAIFFMLLFLVFLALMLYSLLKIFNNDTSENPSSVFNPEFISPNNSVNVNMLGNQTDHLDLGTANTTEAVNAVFNSTDMPIINNNTSTEVIRGNITEMNMPSINMNTTAVNETSKFSTQIPYINMNTTAVNETSKFSTQIPYINMNTTAMEKEIIGDIAAGSINITTTPMAVSINTTTADSAPTSTFKSVLDN
ncbi:hypothetical protein NEPAR06_1629 [Nematocida parisii]|uniref:Uncharacterized protein n=1 Tax=Nematocida parisii (strain ERTm3) TaxID=935791 RepID=I3EGK3_NEMP3|nr:uncharacterized protein NEPG_01156 [Nematocida parisii ERTm1]EIJ88350.1 hypothetical protein NEQG_01794 [Nematocida parisii ERTm3]KAI5144768.1 hypothetical protein NEPAR07_1263 [Nematocida parisii]EIJ93584.1 hypothetical protein NEPG_01156 [Nematocida parisii ERTm1]KAI5155207.1 hypothetical protein NEPAR06_1629 [Nematocida parisii]KAI5157246.1 hypothetical protein NEPAR05_1128 [Nematocida parisii]|eukprot:XP_013058984.1 hypothetical protein NEPG_01156 [Nematocida parisii ERTm1]